MRNWLGNLTRSRADDLAARPPVPVRRHVHFHDHDGLGQHSHAHEHTVADLDHPHSHLARPDRTKVGSFHVF